MVTEEEAGPPGGVERRAEDRAREDRAVKLAVEKALEVAKTTNRLDQHDRHLATINGALARMATEQGRLNDHLLRLDQAQEQRDAVAAALGKALTVASDKQVTTRTFLLGLAVFFVALAGVILGIGTPIH